MSENPIIKVQNVFTGYGSKKVLNDVSFEVYPGEIFMITGVSGCGKTTLLNSMISLLEVISGDIFLDGSSIVKANEKEKLAILRKIGVLYQSGALFGSMSLLENVSLPLKELTALPIDAIQRIAHNKLKMVNLDEFSHYMPASASGGMQKRTAIARAMALDPKILFLDEPSAGLDPSTSVELDQIIKNLSKNLGITFVIVSHDLSSIYNIGQRVIFLHDGRVMAEGKPEALKKHNDPAVYRFFNREPVS
ncbi:MAG: ATP-binding cassette domain-containing protein [Gammaproteobacteria bacterium]